MLPKKHPYISEDLDRQNGHPVTPGEGPECCPFQRFVLDMRCAFEKNQSNEQFLQSRLKSQENVGVLGCPVGSW